ncbi:hypothetical protein [uncultured Neptuniibacter sp.]|uniref:hypothetical protein n=1 Tax=uncultured Neptuniibacter sp. TaxID=502143 RepID=UPI0026098DEC|nr:hypothetical protein [uncultured Neptuniibacter sp.]
MIVLEGFLAQSCVRTGADSTTSEVAVCTTYPSFFSPAIPLLLQVLLKQIVRLDE